MERAPPAAHRPSSPANNPALLHFPENRNSESPCRELAVLRECAGERTNLPRYGIRNRSEPVPRRPRGQTRTAEPAGCVWHRWRGWPGRRGLIGHSDQGEKLIDAIEVPRRLAARGKGPGISGDKGPDAFQRLINGIVFDVHGLVMTGTNLAGLPLPTIKDFGAFKDFFVRHVSGISLREDEEFFNHKFHRWAQIITFETKRSEDPTRIPTFESLHLCPSVKSVVKTSF
jgi:hypothetical protein